MPTRLLRNWTDSLKFEDIAAESERLFTRLIMCADDYGRFHADWRLVRSACFPLDVKMTKATIEKAILDLSVRGLLCLYSVEARNYLAIPNFGQRLKQSKPKFPPMNGESDKWLPTSGNFPEHPGGFGDEYGVVCGDGDDTPKPPEGAIGGSQSAKKPYGEFQGVKLSDDEYEKLVSKHGEARLAKGIAILDDYMRSKGKRYKDHYAVLKETSWVWQRVDEANGGSARRNMI